MRSLVFQCEELAPMNVSYEMLKESSLRHTRRDVKTTKKRGEISRISQPGRHSSRLGLNNTKRPVVMNACLHSWPTGEWARSHGRC